MLITDINYNSLVQSICTILETNVPNILLTDEHVRGAYDPITRTIMFGKNYKHKSADRLLYATIHEICHHKRADCEPWRELMCTFCQDMTFYHQVENTFLCTPEVDVDMCLEHKIVPDKSPVLSSLSKEDVEL